MARGVEGGAIIRGRRLIEGQRKGVEASNVINDPKCNKGPKCNNF